MQPSRALREAAAANARAAEFAEQFIAALEDPRVQEAVEDMLRRRAAARKPKAAPGVTVGSVAAAKALKTSRLAARGREQRG